MSLPVLVALVLVMTTWAERRRTRARIVHKLLRFCSYNSEFGHIRAFFFNINEPISKVE